MSHAIKRAKVHRAYPIPYTLTRQQMHARIPDILWDRLTAAEIAEVLRATDEAFWDGHAAAEREALSEGGIWDPKARGWRDLGPATSEDDDVPVPPIE